MFFSIHFQGVFLCNSFKVFSQHLWLIEFVHSNLSKSNQTWKRVSTQQCFINAHLYAARFGEGITLQMVGGVERELSVCISNVSSAPAHFVNIFIKHRIHSRRNLRSSLSPTLHFKDKTIAELFICPVLQIVLEILEPIIYFNCHIPLGLYFPN